MACRENRFREQEYGHLPWASTMKPTGRIVSVSCVIPIGRRMRAPRRRRPLPRVVGPIPDGVDLEDVARRASYVGSPEHKDAPSFAGQPRPRADASICDRRLISQHAEITRWLRAAIRNACVSGHWEDGFPRYVWHRDGEVVYEGRLVNRANGSYKGYPLNEDEWPSSV